MHNEIFLFPDTAPGSEGLDLDERVFEEDWEHQLKKRIVRGVTRPSLIPCIPKKPNGIAVMVIPGGGYKRQVINLEGTDIANWLNNLGITAFILKHRMPFDGHADGCHVPLQDAQRGIRLIRKSAKEFGIHPNKIGVMGFSAGGHLAATLGTNFEKTVYPAVDDGEKITARPDFLVLAYTEISSKASLDRTLTEHQKARAGILEAYPTDQQITADTPETFIIVADDDETTPSENGIHFYLGLRKVNVPAELHIYKNGGHGFGLGVTRGVISGWTHLCEEWMHGVITDLS
jgi:acetyl esterase/lipase